MSVVLPSQISASAVSSSVSEAPVSALTVRLGDPGRDPRRPAIILLGFDHSYSVTGMGGNDPVGRRFEEAWRAIRHVAKRSRGKTQVGLLSFDQPSSEDVRPAPIANAAHQATLRSKLRVPLDAWGGSDLGPSLEVAEQLAATHPESDVWFVPFSDFALSDHDVPAMLQRLSRFPGHVHAVVLGRPTPEALSGSRVSVNEITPDSPPGSTARAIFAALTATRPGADRTGLDVINGASSVDSVAHSTTHVLAPETCRSPLSGAVSPPVQGAGATVDDSPTLPHNQYPARPAAVISQRTPSRKNHQKGSTTS